MGAKPNQKSEKRGRRFSHRLRRRIATRGSGPGRQILLVFLALAIGCISAFAAVAFREAIDLFQLGLLGFQSESVASLARQIDWWILLAAPSFGGLLVGVVSYFFLPGGNPVGVVQVIQAATLHGGKMQLRHALVGAFVNAFALGAGASVGREGPVVHLGASLASFVSTLLHMGRPMARTLLGCGVAAAVAASFNAPIAGSLFALEVIIGHYAVSAFGPIILSAVTGTLISRAFYGVEPAFSLPDHHIASLWEFPAFALLGLTAGLSAVFLMNAIELIRKLGRFCALPLWLRPAIAGFVIGNLALLWPELLGVGYEATNNALEGNYTLNFLILLLILKLFATSLCMGFGFGNGMFSPSLFIGAMLGCSFGLIAALPVPPDMSSDSGAYALVGMGAVASAVLGAPISTILMIFELTGEYTITLAVMTGAVMASAVTQSLYGRSFFHRQLEIAGVDLQSGSETSLMAERAVKEIIDDNPVYVHANADRETIWAAMQKTSLGLVFVIDRDHCLEGVITISDLNIYENTLKSLSAKEGQASTDPLYAQSLAREPIAVLSTEASIKDAVDLIRGPHDPLIPVIDIEDHRRFVGQVRMEEIMKFYMSAVSEARHEERAEI